MATVIEFLVAKIRAYQHTLEKIDNKTKTDHVSTDLAVNFNRILEDIAKECPDAAPHLPKPVGGGGDRIFRMSGKVPTTYVALEIMVGQVLAVLEVIKAEK